MQKKNIFQKIWVRYFKGAQISPSRFPFLMSGKTQINEDTAMQVSAYHRGLTYISASVAALPWYVKDKTKKILWDDRITTMLDLSPNPEMTSMTWRVWMIQTAINYGNSYCEIERDGIGRPVALWPLDPMSVCPYRMPDGRLVYRITGGDVVNGRDVYLNPKYIFHIKNFHSKDGINGLGVVNYAVETLGISLGGDRFANGLFTNGGMPSGILTLPGSLDDEAIQRIKVSWEENYSGRKVGGTAVLEEGVKYQATAMSPDIMQFLESRKFSVYEIARFLNTTPAKLFAEGAATYNNIEHSNLESVIDVLSWWSKSLEQEADIKLLGNRYGGRKTELNIYEVFRGDMATRSQYFSRMLLSGAMSPNEIRDEEGYAPHPDGDRFFIPTNNLTAIDRMDEVIDSQIAQKLPQITEAPKEDSKEDDSEDAKEGEDLTKAVIDYLRK